MRAAQPPDTVTVTDFADGNELYDRGRLFDSSITPYLCEMQDAFTDPEVEELWFVKPTQVGGTRVIFNMIAYLIVHDPDDTLVVYPTLELAEFVSKNRLQPMFESSPVLRELYLPKESTDLELHFANGMVLVLGGANSPASLASRPVRYVFFDEVDKFPQRAGKEASPIKLAIERTKTFPHNKKIVGASTPTYRHGNIWKQMEGADQVLHFHVPCPHCGHLQEMQFRPYLRWPEGANAVEACETAWYECCACKRRMTDADKREMVRRGKWVVTSQRQPGRRRLAFRMNCFPSPWLRLGEIAREFLSSKDDLEDLMNFINSWLAEPFEQTAKSVSSAAVLERQTAVPEGIVPAWAMLLTGGADFQEDRMYWTIRAWGPGMTSQNIAHGVAFDWSDIEKIMNTAWLKADESGTLMVNLCALDSGNDTDAVEEIHIHNPDWTVLVKGSSSELLSRYRVSVVNRPHSKANGSRLVIVDTGKYKDFIAGRLGKPTGRGAWMVHAECDAEYAAQISSEHKVPKTPGSTQEVWRPKTTTAPNHYLDCEVYAACAADLLQVRFLADADAPAPEQTSSPTPPSTGKASPPDKPWVNVGNDWLSH